MRDERILGSREDRAAGSTKAGAHTPTPWSVQEMNEGCPGPFAPVYIEPQHILIATYRSEERWREDAHFIVRAVNNHAALVACCKRALEHSARVHPDFREQLLAALAAAEGGV